MHSHSAHSCACIGDNVPVDSSCVPSMSEPAILGSKPMAANFMMYNEQDVSLCAIDGTSGWYGPTDPSVPARLVAFQIAKVSFAFVAL